MSLRAIIETNNTAVACICRGKLNEARTLLLRSIRSMRCQLNEDEDVSTKALVQQVGIGTTGDQSCLRTVSVLPLASEQCFQKRGLDSSPLSFFDRVFLVQECADNQNLICAAIIYNMAMVLHLVSLSGETYQFGKVEQLYHVCDVTVQEMKITSSEAHLLALAVINNVAHINSMHLNHRETSKALDDLVSELAFVGQATSIEQDDLQIFQMNAFLHSIRQGFNTAPSA